MSLFGGGDEDDDGPSTSTSSSNSNSFAPGGGGGNSKQSSARLSSLFAQDDQMRSSGNQSLTFTAKKLTTNTATPTSAGNSTPSSAGSSGNSSIIHACPIFLIKYDAQRKPSNVGQRAVALLKGASPSHFQMIVYDPATPTQKQEFTSTISDAFSVSVTFPNYVAFYDENPNGKNYWCFQFPNAESLEAFVKHIALIKHSCTLANNSAWTGILVVDLLVGPADSGRTVANGDAVKYKYSINLLSATHPKGVGALVGNVGSDEKPKMLKLGSQKDLGGIEQALVGMRKGGRRFVLIHHSLAYGNNPVGNIPGQSTLFADIELLRVKYQEEGAAPPKPEKAATPPTTPSLAPQTVPAATPTASAAAVLPPGASDEEKQNVLKRMAALSGGFRLVPGAGITHQTPAQPQPHTPTGASAAAAAAAVAATPTAAAVIAPQPYQQPQAQIQQQPQPQPSPQFDIGVQENALVPIGYHEQNQAQAATTPAPSNAFHSTGFAPQQQTLQTLHPHDTQHQLLPVGAHVPINGVSYPHHMSAVTPYSGAPPGLYHPAQLHGHSHALTPSSVPPVHPPAFAALESKVDGVQQLLTRICTSLGVGSSANAFDPFPSLNAAQVAKSWNSLLSERDTLKSSHDSDAAKISELQAKVTSLHEKSERFLEENRSNLERRFDSFHDELKAKNEKIAILTTEVRRLESEAQNKQFALNESEDKARKLHTDLLAEQQTTTLNKELQRQLQSVKSQLETAQTQMHQTEADTKAAASAQIAQTTSQLHQTKAALEELKASFEAERAELSSSVNALKSRLARNDGFISTLQNQLEDANTKLSAEITNKAQLAQQYEQAKLQIEVNKQTHEVAAKSSASALEHRLEMAQSEVSSWQSKSKQQEEQLSAHKSDLAKLRTELSHSQTALAAANAASTAAANSSAPNAHVEELLAAAKKAEYERGYEEATQALQVKTPAVTTANGNESELQKRITEVEHSLKAAQTELAAAKSEKDAVVEQSKAELAKLRSELQLAQEVAAAASSSSSSATSSEASVSKISEACAASNRDLSVALKDHLKSAMSNLFQSLLDSFQSSADDSATDKIIGVMKPGSKQILVSFASIANEFIEQHQTPADTPPSHSSSSNAAPEPPSEPQTVTDAAQVNGVANAHTDETAAAPVEIEAVAQAPYSEPAQPEPEPEPTPAVSAASSKYTASNSIFATDDDDDGSLFK